MMFRLSVNGTEILTGTREKMLDCCCNESKPSMSKRLAYLESDEALRSIDYSCGMNLAKI